MMNRKRFLERLEDGFDFVFNDTVMTVGGFIVNTFTTVASLYYALTNMLPILPQWAWGAMFVFAFIAGIGSLENVIYLGEDDEDWDDEDWDDEEDEEIVEG